MAAVVVCVYGAGMVIFSSTLCVRAGATSQAAFEVVRQLFVLTIPFSECLSVATQTLCASYLGSQVCMYVCVWGGVTHACTHTHTLGQGEKGRI